MTGVSVRFDQVGLRYGQGREVLSDLSFEVEQGAFLFVTGPSGAGKTSLLRLMYLQQRPTRGLMTLLGRDVSRLDRRDRPGLRRRIGVVFQDFRLLDHLSVIDNVALPLRLGGATESVARDHVAELLDWVGLGDRIDAMPSTLSGGEQQRVAIARAVINRPALLVADEPTGNLDDRMAMRLMYLFDQLNRIGTTVIIATHNQGLIERFDHPVLTLFEGRLLGAAQT